MKTSSDITTSDRRLAGAALTLAALLGYLAMPAAPAAAACPNEELRIAQGATVLPGCMALEMASPPKKFSQAALVSSFSRNGERLLLRIKAAPPGSPGFQDFNGDSYVASRGAQGWGIAATTPADPELSVGGPRSANPSILSPSFDAWALVGATPTQFLAGVARVYRGALDGSFAPISPLLIPYDDLSGNPAVHLIEWGGSSDDLATSVFTVARGSIGYFPEDPRSNSIVPGGGRNSYVVFPGPGGEPALELLARDKDGIVWGGRCGAHFGGAPAGGAYALFNQGAISADGQRIFFSARPAQPWNEESLTGPECDIDNGLRILERTTTPEGPVIAEIAPGDGPEAPGDDLLQAASADGTKVYFTSPRKLAATDTDASAEACGAEVGKSKGCDLYLYDADRAPGDRIVQASAGEGPGPADVLSSIPAVSGDGSRAYFVAQGVLSAGPNPAGESAQVGQPNLYLYEAASDTTSFIATLSADDAGAMWGAGGSLVGDAYAAPLHGPGLQGGGDGHVLAFASKAPLTEDDQDGAFRDVFRYDAQAQTLQRISKAPEGGADNGPFDVTVNFSSATPEGNFNEASRWVSEDGQTIAFATEEALTADDEDGAASPYAWHQGQLGAVPAQIVGLPIAAPLGGQIAFSTAAALLPGDSDAAVDTYVLREGGGFPEPSPPVLCDPLQEGSCQQAEPQPQAPAAPATSSFSGPGNAKEPTRCRKGQVKRRGRCVKARKGKARNRANRRKGGRR